MKKEFETPIVEVVVLTDENIMSSPEEGTSIF